MASRPAETEIPCRIQPVGVPLIPVAASAIARPVGHAVFVLLAVIVLIDGLLALAVDETGSAASRVGAYSREACGQPLDAAATA